MTESPDTKGSVKIKPIKIVLSCIAGIILLVIFIVLGSLLIQKYIKKSSVPMFMGYASLVVSTGSMSGTIEKGDMIIIKKTDDYELGDIITYVEAQGKLPVTHRLVNYGDKEGTFIAKGDANNTTDVLPITMDMIAGEVVLVIPKIGLFFDWFVHGGGVIYVLAMIAIVIACVYFYNILKPSPETDTDSSDSDANIVPAAMPQDSVENKENLSDTNEQS